MSYTNSDFIKSYLVESLPYRQRVENQPIILTGNNYHVFFNGVIDTDSVVVKTKQTQSHLRQSIIVTGSVNSFSLSLVEEGSVVVASDSSLGKIYKENIDYIIDYGSGNLIIKDATAIVINQKLIVWYKEYIQYTNNQDYQIDAETGSIRRLTNSSIASGEAVLLDYTPINVIYDEKIIANAVTTANGLIEKEVDPSGNFGADSTLQTAATFKALELICQAAAVRDMSARGDIDKKVTVWIKLAEMYSTKSEELIKKFRPPFEQINVPTRG